MLWWHLSLWVVSRHSKPPGRDIYPSRPGLSPFEYLCSGKNGQLTDVGWTRKMFISSIVREWVCAGNHHNRIHEQSKRKRELIKQRLWDHTRPREQKQKATSYTCVTLGMSSITPLEVDRRGDCERLSQHMLYCFTVECYSELGPRTIRIDCVARLGACCPDPLRKGYVFCPELQVPGGIRKDPKIEYHNSSSWSS